MALQTQGFGLSALPQLQTVDPRLLVTAPVDLGGALQQGLRGFTLGRELDTQRRRLEMQEAEEGRRATQFDAEAPLRDLIPLQAETSRALAGLQVPQAEQALQRIELQNMAMSQQLDEAIRLAGNEEAFRDAAADVEFQGFANPFMQQQFETWQLRQSLNKKELEAMDKRLEAEQSELERIIESGGKRVQDYQFVDLVNEETGQPQKIAINRRDPSDQILLGETAFAPRAQPRTARAEYENRLFREAAALNININNYVTVDEDGNETFDFDALTEAMNAERERRQRVTESIRGSARPTGLERLGITEPTPITPTREEALRPRTAPALPVSEDDLTRSISNLF